MNPTRKTNTIRSAALVLALGGLSALASTTRAQVPAEDQAPAEDPSASSAEPGTTEGEDDETPWYDGFELGAFVDAYYNMNFQGAEGNTPTLAAHRAYEENIGFGLAFGGVDIAYERGPIGATLNLRVGDGQERLMGLGSRPVVANMQEAYATWTPLDLISVDFGVFSTLYGAEYSRSWKNLNYTRGALYYLMQPFWHTGLRANLSYGGFGATLMVVNGTNRIIESDDISPHLGLQVSYDHDLFHVCAGYYMGRSGSGFGLAADPGSLEHFFDVVATLSLGDFKLIFNGDAMSTGGGGSPNADWFGGVSLAAGYDIVEFFRVAARVEFLRDGARVIGDGWANLLTTTLTLDARPQENLILRLEGRLEWADEETFVITATETDNLWGTVTLGVVVTTNP